MPCTNPMQVYFEYDVYGNKKLLFSHVYTRNMNSSWQSNKNQTLTYRDDFHVLPCGRCQSCRIAHAKMWSLRCYLESLQYESSLFITLTYAPKFVPYTNFADKKRRLTLKKEDYQNFIKRLRMSYQRKLEKVDINVSPSKYRLRYFGCGEYGTQNTCRPHYHFIFFNLKLDDLVFHSKSKSGEITYTSKYLTDLWGMGNVIIGTATKKSAGYVARYTMKKQTRFDAENEYLVDGKQSEFLTMSNSIAKNFFIKYYKNFYQLDKIVVDGIKHSIPRYFDKLLDKIDPALLYTIKFNRAIEMKRFLINDELSVDDMKSTSFNRLKVKEKLVRESCKLLVRTYENSE